MINDKQLGDIAVVVGAILSGNDLTEEEKQYALEILDKVKALSNDDDEEEVEKDD